MRARNTTRPARTSVATKRRVSITQVRPHRVQRAERRLGHPARRVVRADGQPDLQPDPPVRVAEAGEHEHELVRAVLRRQPQARDRPGAPPGLRPCDRPLVDEGVVGADPGPVEPLEDRHRVGVRPLVLPRRPAPLGGLRDRRGGVGRRERGGRPQRAGGEPARERLRPADQPVPRGTWSLLVCRARSTRIRSAPLHELVWMTSVPERLALTRNTATPSAFVTLRLL